MGYTVLDSVCVVSADDMNRNLEANLGRGLPQCEPMPERTTRLAIVGSGPSVRDYLEEIKSFDGHVWAVNGAYDYLRDNGFVPHGFLGCDPLPGLDEYLKNPHKDTTFYLAGTVDPSTIEAVKDYDVRLWFLAQSVDIKYPKGTWLITGGTTMLLRAPFLSWMLGYRDLTFYGADSSFDTTKEQRYVYGDGRYQWDSKAPVNWVKTQNGEGPFPTELCLMKQVSQFGAVVQYYRGKLTFRCGGLLDAFLRSPMGDGSQFDAAFQGSTHDLPREEVPMEIVAHDAA